jgi:chromosomal replication initiation ATPase DnaA
LAAVWNRVLELLAGRVNKPTYEAHLRPLVLAEVTEAGGVLLLVPHAATREWIEKRHLPAIQEALVKALGRPVTVQLCLADRFRAEIADSLSSRKEQ